MPMHMHFLARPMHCSHVPTCSTSIHVPQILDGHTLRSSQLITDITAVTTVGPAKCKMQCGDIKIQYPFGIGAECSMDKWFVIVCNGTDNSRRAFLSSINMEVIKIIYRKSNIKVKGPVIFSNCSESGHRKTGKPLNLTQTPFTFAGSNRFTVVGCHNRALLTSAEPDIIGCQPTCDNKLKPQGRDPICLGNRCCQTTIPYYLQVFKPRFDDAEDEKRTEGCRLAILVEDRWFRCNIKDPSKVQERAYVPLLLDWKINATALESLQINEETTKSDTIRYYDEFGFPYPNNTVLLCRNGYTGNPYLHDGCQDIDECKDPKVQSQCNGICTNTRGSYKCKGDKSWIIILGVSVSTGVLVLVISVWWLTKFIKKRRNIKRKRKFFKQNGGMLLQQQLTSSQANVDVTKIFSSKELEKATDHFNVNRILGQGGQGTVYKGMLVDGRIVAVKKSKKVDEAKLKEFINEVVILSQINHRNVVKLLGCCLETEVPLLVYEFIPNGTLYQYLHEHNEDFPLSWENRLRIAIEVSGALSYLHSAASIPIYHRDIKSTNILLDDKYRAKVSDFGTSRYISIDQTHLTTHVQGTFGYFDPEYFQSSQFTEKSDVYSFGVVLVELLTGQKPISPTRLEEGIGLAAHFILSMQNDKLFDIIDTRIMDECDKEEVIVVANLARRCLNLKGKRRPTMKEVTTELEGIRMSKTNFELIESSHFDVPSTWKTLPSTDTGTLAADFSEDILTY